MTRLSKFGTGFDMAPVFKINALMAIMVSQSREYFELWESDLASSSSDLKSVFTGVFGQVKDYARR